MANRKGEKKQRVILVVDELELLNRYGQQLELCGYGVTFTHRGDFALEMLDSGRYDAVVIGMQIGGPQIASTNVTAQTTAGVTPEDLAQEITRRHCAMPVIVVADKKTVNRENAFRRHTEGVLPTYPRYVIDRFKVLRLSVNKVFDGAMETPSC